MVVRLLCLLLLGVVRANAHCSVSAPANGELGSCSSILALGDECEVDCDDGYEAIGRMSCGPGIGGKDMVVEATCEPQTFQVNDMMAAAILGGGTRRNAGYGSAYGSSAALSPGNA